MLALCAISLALISCAGSGMSPSDQSGVVPGIHPPKTNSMTIWAHYMPWFDGEYSLGHGRWGWHWTMNAMNPNVVDQASGRRQIASHYYPLIGPYSSSDPDVAEYHALLMKYAGIDGILIDWYGSRRINDFGTNLDNSNALIAKLRAVGLQFAVVYEDWSCDPQSSLSPATRLENARADMSYLESNYFSKDEYIRLGGENLFPVFGPRLFTAASDWSSILQGHASTRLMPLDGRMGGIGATSEFDWPYQDLGWPVSGGSHKSYLESFNASRAKASAYPVASAYPCFDDFYAEGGVGSTLFKIDPYDGTKGSAAEDPCATLAYTLNDFGEGTMIEPTEEFHYSSLERIQQFSGVGYGELELETVHRLYEARKRFSGDAVAQGRLDECFAKLTQLKVAEATRILGALDAD